ncbi:MAG: RNA pyrophosphohydrolase [Gammaproteobacteria bacterium]|nr:RNA pyrophosphohydrolase [Gammaproteobacteria bacterium]
MIDEEGYRPNVGIILSNAEGRVLWARRIGQDAWQFPQGGIKQGESAEQALYRELFEEVGLRPKHVEIIGSTDGWLRYRLPERYIRWNSQPLCIGQKQVWFMLRLTGEEQDICLTHADTPEFDHWRWVDYWYPLDEVVSFKRDVYKDALKALEHLIFG